jgi:hypothetical protein
LVGHREITRNSRCLFSFVTRARPSRPFHALRDTPKTALNFGRLVGWSVGRSWASHTNLTLPLQFRHPGLPFLTLLRPAGHPQNALKSLSVGRLVTGKSHERHAASSVLSPGPTLPDPSTPCGPPPKRPLILVGRSVGRSVTGKSHERHAASSVSSPGPTLPDPFTPCGATPKRP